ncbi:MAG TPA: tetratricopeptide repeat protein [Candidatus Binatia bacterium]|nr:tetratricopeptide repeat protein [Candidatus Binatia bacterium]
MASHRGRPIVHRTAIVAIFGLLAAICTVVRDAASLAAAQPEPTNTAAEPRYVGRAACGPCHQREVQRFTGSHHDRSMQVADAATVLGDFNNATVTYNGVTSAFFRKDNQFFVRTDGPDGALHEYRIVYTFGIDPLQQYLVEFPGGRLQALSLAWDTRPKNAGGQRWFHLYPNDKVDFRDVLHWTGPAQNWNYMCAECHSTNVKKNFRPQQNRFETTWSEVDVSCEACHGPASQHVTWANGKQAGREIVDSTKGLIVDLSARGGAWMFEGTAPIAHLSGARDTRVQIVCARCHARRAQIAEDYRQDQPLGETHLLSLFDEGLYFADGQIRDEVFEYGSFLQSRMHEKGVVCTDCHDPHTARLRADGNAVCARCHVASHYDTPAHHHHKPATDAARCVRCHMPQRTYMVVHTRHDHSFRVPRPDLSVTLATPNACAECHHDHSAQWAADAVVKWYGPTRTRGPRYAPAFAAGRQHQAGADRLLAAVIGDRSYPAIVRATALSLLAEPGRPPLADVVEQSLNDPEPLVRRAAATTLSAREPNRRWQIGGPLLRDPIRIVRVETVNALADAAGSVTLSADQRESFDRAVAEYRDVQAFNADRAESWLNLGALEARLGNRERAEADYRRAISLQPSFMPPYVNLADLYREQGRDAEGERVLRQALALQPSNADAHHALGLLLVRTRRLEPALAELAKAAELNADNPRYAYVYGVALDSAGRRADALNVLEGAQKRFTGDRDIVTALLQWSAQTGDRDGAARWAEKLRELD